MANYLLLCLFGSGVGVLSGLLGIGGGVALVPGLVFFFGFTQAQAQGTSLAVLSLPILLFAALVYYQHGHVDLREVGWIALGFVGGAFLGAMLVNGGGIPLEALRVGFGVMLLYVGFMFVFDPGGKRPAAALPAGLLAALAAILAWLLRRKPPTRSTPEAPGGEVEYHL